MSTLNFIITDAGRQAAINADATGVQLTLTEVGYGTGNWSPDKTATALQSEFKRLPAGGGDNPAPLYVHIAVTDQSSDTYQSNEVAVYAGNVLFAVWSKGLQPDTDGPGKISSGDSAFVFDLLLDNVPPGSVTVGDANFSVPLATEIDPGIAVRSSLIKALGGLDNDCFITPFLLEEWRKEKIYVGYPGQLFEFTTPDLPDGFPGFITNGSRVPNGRLDYPKLASSGSSWISIEGDDLIVHDSPDMTRGQGSSDRSVGYFENDAMINVVGTIAASWNSDHAILDNLTGPFYSKVTGNRGDVPQYGGTATRVAGFDLSRVVRTASENRVRSKTVLRAIYHGEL